MNVTKFISTCYDFLLTAETASLFFSKVIGRPAKHPEMRMYGRLTPIRCLGVRNKHLWHLWLCACGTLKEIQTSSVLNNLSQSCGCLNSDRLHQRHGAPGASIRNALFINY